MCGFDFNLTYPQQSKFPSVGSPILPTEEFRAAALVNQPSGLLKKRFNALVHGLEATEAGIVRRESRPTHAEVQAREHKRREWLAKKNSLRHRDLSGRANGTIDPWYGCFLQSEVQDYALNFSLPWSELPTRLSFNAETDFSSLLDLSQQTEVPGLDDFGPYNVGCICAHI